MPFSFVDEMEENIVDGTTDESTEIEEFSIDAVEGGFEEIAFTRVLRVEEFEEIEDEGLVNVSFGEVGVEVGALDESEEELVDDLEMGPCKLEHRFVFFWVERVTCWVYRRRNGAEEICCELMMAEREMGYQDGGATHHVDNLRIDVLSDDAALGSDILEHLVEGLGFDLLALELCTRVVEVKEDATLVELFEEQLGTFVGGCFCR